MRSQIIHQSLSLSSPLVRAVVTSKISGFAENRGYVLGVSTLEGYSYPLRRYLVLIETLRGQKYDPLVSNIEILPGSPEFQILKQLYNVRYRIKIEQGTAIVQFLESPTGGEAWFSLEVKTEPGVDELVRELKKWAQDIHSKAAQQLLLDESDLVIQKKKIVRPFSSECALSRVNGIGSLMTDQSIGIQVFNPSQTCPLTVSMNYSDVLKVTGRRNDGTTLELLSFPSYGSLMGVLVEPGEPGIQEVFISTRS